MKIQWHVLTAIPFLLAGHPEGALMALLPDAPWVPHEVVYRRARRKAEELGGVPLPWHEWVQRYGALNDNLLHLYRLSHSALFALLLCSIIAVLHDAGVAGWMAAGWATHLALDLFTHDGPLRLRPLYPLSNWRWPWVARPWRWGREKGSVEAVMLSGGWESAACLALATERAARTGAKVVARHFQYAQPYWAQELVASQKLARVFGVEWREERVDCALLERGVFEDRNERFVAHLASALPPPDAVWFGARGPLRTLDRHGDSNAQWVKEMEQKYRVRIRTPLLLHPKWLVKARARARGVRDEMVFSSEGWKYDDE